MSTMIPLSLLISLDDGGGTKISLQWHTPRIWGNKRKAQEIKITGNFSSTFQPAAMMMFIFIESWSTEKVEKVMSWWWERERWFKRGKKGAMMNADFFASSYFIPFSTIFSALHLSSFSFTCTIFILRHIFLL